MIKVKLTGKGSRFNPYIINNIDDLIYLSKNPLLWNNKHFRLTSSIDAGKYNFTPIGWESILFNGIFEGNGYKIKNLTLNLPNIQGVGLFGHIGSAAKIKSVILANVNIIGKDGCGGIAGCNEGGEIKSCKVESGIIKAIKETEEISIGICIGANYNGGLVRNNSGKAMLETFNKKYESSEKKDFIGYDETI